MKAPVAPDGGASCILYGDREFSINRRGLVGGIALAAFAPTRPAAAQTATIARALAGQGGRNRLARVRKIAWTGQARLLLPERQLMLAVETEVEPFVRARSATYIVSEGRKSLRTMVIEPDRGYAIRDGREAPLHDATVRHERQQFGIYGYMLLAAADRLRATGDYGLRAERGGFPPADLTIDDAGRLIAADYTVAAPDGGADVPQRLTFAGAIVDQGVRWPRRIAIAQAGKSYFDLTVETLKVTLA